MGFAWVVLVCSQQGICRGDRAHEDAAGSAVDVDGPSPLTAEPTRSSSGALYGEIKVGGPADGEVSIDFQFVVFEFDFDQLSSSGTLLSRTAYLPTGSD